ncbi:GNAT family N-acetyltransferase [Kutzneria sp. CA-103260]|uniref:GNAT family N-acetyltransferase n=1 Tax=Kutzneria sp. CA-103260 TaxID=2802641 RepID=UPI001BA78B70|nr:GNAT family N-acetyltransferase [Kutzneria sp. CA-103260]QUQ65116.1 Mycothiol acetyltransferase [Kutzneria sp. CA-103260]
MTTIRVPLHVRDLTPADVSACTWSGGRRHVEQLHTQLARAHVDYLAVCPPSDSPVAIGAVDYTAKPGAGLLFQLAVMPALQSCGIGTILIHAAEDRIRRRSLSIAELSVEHDNPRAQALYERLGYRAYGTERDGWHEDGPDGTAVWYETDCTLMRRELASMVV